MECNSKNTTVPPKTRWTPEEMQSMKNRSKCRRPDCGKYGHWCKDHVADGSLKSGANSSDSPIFGEETVKRVSGRNHLLLILSSLDRLLLVSIIQIGPLLDDGAPYSGIGLVEFKLIQSILLPHWKGRYDYLPSCVQDRPFSQYGTGTNSSKARKILGSVLLSARNDRGTTISIIHLLIEGSSQWIIGRNVPQKRNIIRIGENKL